MNEIIDKLIIRIFLLVFICVIIVLYKYSHFLLYPSSKGQFLKRFYPSKNPAETVHLFGRILGLGLLFSQFQIYLMDGFFYAFFDFFITAVITYTLYLVALYIMESIALYNFEYNDEISKKKNMAYALVTMAHALGVAHLLQVSINVSTESGRHVIILIIFLWLFTVVIIGFASKTFKIISKLHFNQLLVQKNLAIGFSYLGFFLGWTIIVASAINLPIGDIKNYGIQVILKILLSLIIFPLFRWALIYIFKIEQDPEEVQAEGAMGIRTISTGYGIYEGIIQLTSAYLTTVITGNIHFSF
ncbi:MAG: hypothetical protein DRQ88_07750 [Epsilonproteobacteria bacterium]|nr:MAG: hypothetical protein DRQ89_04910 [Campylobacterota bacterium]RLA66149.1 MAG: hypothetical protein DRQ88_07750 [Campylobacterota bacterium]